LAKPHALRLLNAYSKINDEASRLAVLQLIESISCEGKPVASRQRRLTVFGHRGSAALYATLRASAG
jgi:hypothetical protein